MRKLVITLCLVLACSGAYAYDLTLNDTPVSVYFSPRGGGQQAIIEAIGHAPDGPP